MPAITDGSASLASPCNLALRCFIARAPIPAAQLQVLANAHCPLEHLGLTVRSPAPALEPLLSAAAPTLRVLELRSSGVFTEQMARALCAGAAGTLEYLSLNEKNPTLSTAICMELLRTLRRLRVADLSVIAVPLGAGLALESTSAAAPSDDGDSPTSSTESSFTDATSTFSEQGDPAMGSPDLEGLPCLEQLCLAGRAFERLRIALPALQLLALGRAYVGHLILCTPALRELAFPDERADTVELVGCARLQSAVLPPWTTVRVSPAARVSGEDGRTPGDLLPALRRYRGPPSALVLRSCPALEEVTLTDLPGPSEPSLAWLLADAPRLRGVAVRLTHRWAREAGECPAAELAVPHCVGELAVSTLHEEAWFSSVPVRLRVTAPGVSALTIGGAVTPAKLRMDHLDLSACSAVTSLALRHCFIAREPSLPLGLVRCALDDVEAPFDLLTLVLGAQRPTLEHLHVGGLVGPEPKRGLLKGGRESDGALTVMKVERMPALRRIELVRVARYRKVVVHDCALLHSIWTNSTLKISVSECPSYCSRDLVSWS